MLNQSWFLGLPVEKYFELFLFELFFLDSTDLPAGSGLLGLVTVGG